MAKEDRDTYCMKPEDLLAEYFSPMALPIIIEHSRCVANKALQIAQGSPIAAYLDKTFIEEAALLHDIGVSMTDAPALDCHGSSPYICHGVLGRDILEKTGLPLHALVCERHIGVGLTVEDIIAQNLPLPHRDMLPLSNEEKIIACADLFYSKKRMNLSTEKTIGQIRQDLAKFAQGKVAVFDGWLQEFSVCI
jgi:uncharacterized protein